MVRDDWISQYEVEEKNSRRVRAGGFQGRNWSGNVGLRYVRTEEDVVTYVLGGPRRIPDAIVGSAFGSYKRVPVDNNYNDVLPSANLKWDINDDLVARFAASMTMTRPDYSALAGFVSLARRRPRSTRWAAASGGNPNLKPIRSTNFDAGLEWYFAQGSLLSAGLFYMDLDNYVAFGTERKTYLTFSDQFPNGQDLQYDLTVPDQREGSGPGCRTQLSAGRYARTSASPRTTPMPTASRPRA